MSQDFFQEKAKIYENDPNRVDNVTNIANLILKEISFNKSDKIMDFGAGTGLLLEKIAPYVDTITAIDISNAMIEELKKKEKSLPCNLELFNLDLTTETLDTQFNGVISSMTFHHIQDIDKIFKTLYSMLKSNSTIAISDLDREDGTFHTEDTGVFHFGFDREKLVYSAKNAGFENVKIQDVGDVIKPHGVYSVFLLTATKK